MPYPQNYQPGYTRTARRQPGTPQIETPAQAPPVAPGVAPPPPVPPPVPPRARPAATAAPVAAPQPQTTGYPARTQTAPVTTPPPRTAQPPAPAQPPHGYRETGPQGPGYYSSSPGAIPGSYGVHAFPEDQLETIDWQGANTKIQKKNVAAYNAAKAAYQANPNPETFRAMEQIYDADRAEQIDYRNRAAAADVPYDQVQLPGGAQVGSESPGYDPMEDLGDDGDDLLGPGGAGADGYRGDLDALLRESLQNPSRYDLPLVEQGMAAIERDITKQRENAVRQLDEHFASRGLIGYGGEGSSIENDARRNLLADLEDQRLDREFELGREFATTYSQDRNAAAQLGFTQQDIDMRADEIRQRYALEGRRLDQQHAQFLASQELAREQMSQQGSQFDRSLAFDQSRFDQQMKADADRFQFQQDQWFKELDLRKQQQVLEITGALAAAGWKKDRIEAYLNSIGMGPNSRSAQAASPGTQPAGPAFDPTNDLGNDDDIFRND